MIRINYVTSSKFKEEEIKIFTEKCTLSDGTPIKGNFEFHIFPNTIHERLEVNIETMVIHEVKEAYSIIKIPCIVEHAGLIFEKYKTLGYPGGLTKPMWNTLGNEFLVETNSAGSKVTARAVIGYCDGKNIRTFVGETCGILADSPRGSRNFYWDTVFVPDPTINLTYAEIVELKGIEEKIIKYSQSAKALLSFLEFIRTAGNNDFWN